ncbi:response regulator transcription factor [Pedobacter arcticus]|uniref:response regulator transcription factor n=1 Tax=Pedobacter arcticus TaxID=752140 RepID=UPI0002E2857F|nr:response regulator [Pedobacter arcticus]
MRILIIEDEIIIARFIEQQLKANFSCTVQIAINYNEVLDVMPEFLPHLLLCDINLNEKLDGIAMVKELEKSYAFEVIFITSYQSKIVIGQASTVKPLHYLIKPVDEAAIYAAIRLASPVIEANGKLGQLQPEYLPELDLNDTERYILGFVLANKTTKEIADILHLSHFTVKNYRHKLCRKLNLKDENNALLKWALANEGKIS